MNVEIDSSYFHVDCAECCAIGRCHWCLSRPGPAVFFEQEKQIVVRACAKHADLVKNSNRFPDAALVAFDGTFRPIELTLDEPVDEISQTIRASNSMHAASTPATLR